MRRAIVSGLTAVVAAGALLTGPARSAEVLALPTFTVERLLAIASVPAPPEGIGLQIHADFPAEAPLEIDGFEIYSFTADITPEGSVVTRSAVTSSNASDDDTPTVGECDDPTFAPLGVKWKDEMPITWRLNLHSIPGYISEPYTLTKVRRAHHVWPRARSNCEDKEESRFGYDYLGNTWKHPGYDGVNVIDFGRLGGGSLAVNYTWYSGTRILEVDLRLNKVDHKWTNRAWRRNRYHIRNVVAHELGHQIGLDDLSDPHRALTMFGRIGKGETSKITLGRGDLRGAATLSP